MENQSLPREKITVLFPSSHALEDLEKVTGQGSSNGTVFTDFKNADQILKINSAY